MGSTIRKRVRGRPVHRGNPFADSARLPRSLHLLLRRDTGASGGVRVAGACGADAGLSPGARAVLTTSGRKVKNANLRVTRRASASARALVRERWGSARHLDIVTADPTCCPLRNGAPTRSRPDLSLDAPPRHARRRSSPCCRRIPLGRARHAASAEEMGSAYCYQPLEQTRRQVTVMLDVTNRWFSCHDSRAWTLATIPESVSRAPFFVTRSAKRMQFA